MDIKSNMERQREVSARLIRYIKQGFGSSHQVQLDAYNLAQLSQDLDFLLREAGVDAGTRCPECSAAYTNSVGWCGACGLVARKAK